MTVLSGDGKKGKCGGEESIEKHQVFHSQKTSNNKKVFTFVDGSVHFVGSIIYGFSIDGDERRKQLFKM